ncbi:type I restriction enzyme HsdR N-terminal domain-containing protein [Lacihabitans sp. LS3-19]|uniref:type I restriction enzyme HsdR N-terminal domain-containing protein n=1 Tax=Lacihabitans sp. LS3-19 TaxID=2487335 RepID=UPI0020CD5E02|nr:type I restriction enzyme HsdR N-terminal domain-containing protein [Lacihabitans sp. LS3-19]MCP9770138.1 type I restriction enzyme HsdR N-terminal domain-containing protein [Lacihabitans sp. LS3-19]
MNIKNEKRKIKEVDGKQYIFDYLRKKYIFLSPEEIVRQNFLDYLIEEKKYSKNLIKLESGIVYNSLNKRSDILVYDNKGVAFLLVECKATTVAITQNTIEQASRYNLIIKAPYLCVTNGIKTFCFNINFENNKIQQINEIPLIN